MGIDEMGIEDPNINSSINPLEPVYEFMNDLTKLQVRNVQNTYYKINPYILQNHGFSFS